MATTISLDFFGPSTRSEVSPKTLAGRFPMRQGLYEGSQYDVYCWAKDETSSREGVSGFIC